MSNPTRQLVQKLWNYCNILQDEGLSYGDYVEQLTFLLFLKMGDEQSKPPFNKPSPIPKGKDWPALLAKDGDELLDQFPGTRKSAHGVKPVPRLLLRALGGTEVHWASVLFRFTRHTLKEKGSEKGTLGLICGKVWSAFRRVGVGV